MAASRSPRQLHAMVANGGKFQDCVTWENGWSALLLVFVLVYIILCIILCSERCQKRDLVITTSYVHGPAYKNIQYNDFICIMCLFTHFTRIQNQTFSCTRLFDTAISFFFFVFCWVYTLVQTEKKSFFSLTNIFIVEITKLNINMTSVCINKWIKRNL